MEPELGLYFYYLLNFPFFLSAFPSMELGGVIFFVIALLFSSALISSSEVAFFSLNSNDLAKLQEEETPAALRIIRLKETPRKLLATILISNNFINIAIVVLSDYILRKILPDETYTNWANSIIHFFGFENITSRWFLFLADIEWWSKLFNLSITIVGVTFLLVLFGEVTPKIYAKLNNVKLAKFMSFPLIFLNSFFTPVSLVLVKATNLVERKLASQTGTNVASREDIHEAIELTVSHEDVSNQEVDLLKGIVKFGEVAVKQIMKSRVDVIALDIRVNFEEVLNVVRESGYSRIPVFDDDFDHVTGILYVKDLLEHLDENKNFEWQKIIRTNVLYVPEAKKINDLLKEFQKERMHLAVVVDEYGGSAGIVTLEDVMEEVIGEIKGEFDDEVELDYTKIDDWNYIFEGKTLLNDACRLVGVDTTTFDNVKGDADTVAGLMLEILGYIPKIDIEVNSEGFKFKVIAVNKRRIEKIQMTLPKENLTPKNK